MKINAKHILFGVLIIIILYLIFKPKDTTAQGETKPPKTEPSDVIIVNERPNNEATEPQVDENFGSVMDKNADGYFDDTDEATRLLNQRVLDDARSNYCKIFVVTQVPQGLSAGALNTLTNLWKNFMSKTVAEVLGVDTAFVSFGGGGSRLSAMIVATGFQANGEKIKNNVYASFDAKVKINGQNKKIEDHLEPIVQGTRDTLLSVATEEQLLIVLARF